MLRAGIPLVELLNEILSGVASVRNEGDSWVIGSK
jgi:hypothetical protein